MRKLGKYWALGLVFLLVMSAASLKADGLGFSKLKIRPVRLEILDAGTDIERDQDDWMTLKPLIMESS